MTADEQLRKQVVQTFSNFNEPVYLHQVIAKHTDGNLTHYPDLQPALDKAFDPSVNEWRAHYHVPIFVHNYGVLESTQHDIVKVLNIQSASPFTFHMEIETYTWEVLPVEMRLPVADSIVREIEWVIDLLKREPVYTGEKYA